MKKISVLIFVFLTTISVYSQSYLQDGDRCFDNSDYDCAITHYNNAFKYTTGKDKQIAEIKLTRAKWCADHIKTANQAFAAKNYSAAKDEYQKVLDSNPKDNYAQSQIEKCNKVLNPPKLRKATTAELTDIWNNKYGVMPERRQKLIAAGIDPEDAQKRINNGEGKPVSENRQAITLDVSNQNISFPSGGGNKTIYVNTNARYFQIFYLPSWCKVENKYQNSFSLVCYDNTTESSRSDWFKILAGEREVRVYVSQAGIVNSSTQKKQKNTLKKVRGCFNCPKANYTWGITAGYVQKSFGYKDGIQLGLRIDPLFRYGFGLNMGVIFEGYTQNSFSLNEEIIFEQFALNIPFHLEYRLNFSKWFNVFAYGGAGINFVTDSSSEGSSWPTTIEYGGGLRINHLQFNIGKSLYWGNLKNVHDFRTPRESYQDLIFSVSYMF